VTRRTAGALTGVFACGAAIFVVISLLRSDFRLPWVQAATTIAVTAGLVLAATMCKDRGRAASAARAPGRMVVGLFGFVAGIGWFVLFLAAFIGGPVSFVWWTAGALSFAAAVALVLRRGTRRQWTPRQQLVLCFGAGMSAAIFGLLLVALDGNRANTAFQCVVIAALIAAYVSLDRRLSHQGALEFT
jgi:hypothetical protein